MGKADAQTATETVTVEVAAAGVDDLTRRAARDVEAGRRVLYVAEDIRSANWEMRGAWDRLEASGILYKAIQSQRRLIAHNGGEAWFASVRSVKTGSCRGLAADSLYFIGYPGDWSDLKFTLLPVLAGSESPRVRIVTLDDQ